METKPSNNIDHPPHFGPILIVLVVLLICLLVGLFLWGNIYNTTTVEETSISRPTATENNEPESTTAEAQVETLGALSPSTERSAIEADLGATEIDSLNSEFINITQILNNPSSGTQNLQVQ